MKTVADVLERLGRLSKGDRVWIVENLSAAARTKLREDMEPERGAGLPGPAAGKETDEAADARVLDLLDGARAGAALAGEPAWLIAALIGFRPWPWEEQMLARIAPVTRMEVNRLQLTAPRVSPAMSRLLMKCLRERVSGATTPSISAFDQLVENAGSPAYWPSLRR